MRTLRFLLRKEFKQIFRNRSLLPLIFVMPIVQLLVMPLAADYEVKNINISIIDHDNSSTSRELIREILASGYFKRTENVKSFQEGFHQVENNTADLILEIPIRFEENIYRNENPELFIAVNAINGTKAALGGSYLSAIIRNFNKDLFSKIVWSSNMTLPKQIMIKAINWYNPNQNYRVFMVPGILCILVTMVGAYMCGLNIVKEKEIGTIEQINVSPIRKSQYILGKLLPFWIIGVMVFSIGFFLISWGVYGIVPLGNLVLIYGFLALYLVAILGFGLLISTYSDTQQQAMSLSFFFMMIFILMSGLFTSIDSMPLWAKTIAHLNPVTYFIEVMRMVVLKGSNLTHISRHVFVMIAFALFFNTWAVLNYRKSS